MKTFLVYSNLYNFFCEVFVVTIMITFVLKKSELVKDENSSNFVCIVHRLNIFSITMLVYLSFVCLLSKGKYQCYTNPGGVLRYISDGDVRMRRNC